jgi:hypothetical protein
MALRGREAPPYDLAAMCRNIRVLYNFDPHTTADEIHAAALQYVRKVSGLARPPTWRRSRRPWLTSPPPPSTCCDRCALGPP